MVTRSTGQVVGMFLDPSDARDSRQAPHILWQRRIQVRQATSTCIVRADLRSEPSGLVKTHSDSVEGTRSDERKGVGELEARVTRTRRPKQVDDKANWR